MYGLNGPLLLLMFEKIWGEVIFNTYYYRYVGINIHQICMYYLYVGRYLSYIVRFLFVYQFELDLD